MSDDILHNLIFLIKMNLALPLSWPMTSTSAHYILLLFVLRTLRNLPNMTATISRSTSLGVLVHITQALAELTRHEDDEQASEAGRQVHMATRIAAIQAVDMISRVHNGLLVL